MTLTGPAGEKQVSVFLPGRVPLTATAKDASGVAMSGAAFTFTSRNILVATIDGAGVVSATGFGSTYVIATLVSNGRSLSDSVRVVVPQ